MKRFFLQPAVMGTTTETEVWPFKYSSINKIMSIQRVLGLQHSRPGGKCGPIIIIATGVRHETYSESRLMSRSYVLT